MSALKDKLKPVTGVRKQFLLMRIAGLDTPACRHILSIPQGTYNSWLSQENFREVFSQLQELESDYKHEAIQMLRRENQLEAVLLESKIVQKMREELEAGEYVLIKTNLAREVYSKLISDLDIAPQVKASISWEQKVYDVMLTTQPQLQGEIHDAEFTEVSSQPNQYSEGNLITEGEQASHEDKARA